MSNHKLYNNILRVIFTLFLIFTLICGLTILGHKLNGSTEEFLAGVIISIITGGLSLMAGLWIWRK
jgi:hypothetical protein